MPGMAVAIVPGAVAIVSGAVANVSGAEEIEGRGSLMKWGAGGAERGLFAGLVVVF